MKSLNVFLKALIVCLLIFSCSNSDDKQIEEEEEIILDDVTANVIFWEFTADTGNSTSRLRYEIEFNNPNDIDITGYWRITTNADGLVSTKFSSNNAPCYLIEANSSCTLSFDAEDSHEIGMIKAITLVSVEYNLEDQI